MNDQPVMAQGDITETSWWLDMLEPETRERYDAMRAGERGE